jgi:MoaA/NifB/PqqE/SkfB family radical SAM enzyme
MIKKITKKCLELAQFINYVPPPFQLIIEITHKCNLSCGGCPRDMGGLSPVDMSYNNFVNIVDQIPQLQRIVFVGRGEPFINPDFFQMLNYIKNKQISITTNGTMLTKYKRNILELPKLELVVSYDDKHGVHLNVKDFDNVVLQAMLGHCSIMQVLLEAEEIRAKKVSFIYPIGFMGNNVKPLDYWYDVYNMIQLWSRKTKIEVSIPSINPTRDKCLEPWYSLRVGITGDVYPCCYIYNGPEWTETWNGYTIEPSQKNYKMGNMLSGRLKHFWNGNKYTNLRKYIASIRTGYSISNEELQTKRTSTSNFCETCLYKWGRAC